ncbi:MAG: glycosyltransferase [Gammaproteobacteria bacterium]|nr:glycosyltransferase [Gammaproteobacteria bacterium]
MRIITFTTLYPNAQQPGHGIFVQTRLQRLLQFAPEIDARVIAPVPYYPPGLPGPAHYRQLARVPDTETLHGIEVDHPRFLVLPKIGMNLAPGTLARAAITAARRLRARGFDFDLIDAHYFYPDGVAAAQMSQALGVPFTVTARGSDINVIADYPKPRQRIVAAANNAAQVFTVSAALRDRLVRLGAAADNIVVARNGVDPDLFAPVDDREALRRDLGMSSTTLISVGNLVELKGHHLVIDALGALEQTHLWIIGDGPEKSRLVRQAQQLGLTDRVRFIPRTDQQTLRRYYAAADALVLASSREGWANVLLEAMACGTPVVATAVSGNPEVVADPAAGELVDQRSSHGLAAGIRRLLQRQPDRSQVRRYAERFSWDATSALQAKVFGRIIRERNS